MTYETLFKPPFPFMGLILGLFAGVYFLYVYFKVDRSVTMLLYGILSFTFAGIFIYPFSLFFGYIALALLILTFTYVVLYDRGFYKRFREKSPKLDLISKIFPFIWLVVYFALYIIYST